jgi:hypothetical protein
MRTKQVMLGFVTLAVMLTLVVPGLGQEVGKGVNPAVSPKALHKVTMDGKVVFLKSYSGYVVIRQKPHEEYKIINENAEVLGPLAKEGKTVKIEGTLQRGAYFLSIDKINGKEYQGTK